jgi:DNA-binding CsgD family transcriptional regulator
MTPALTDLVAGDGARHPNADGQPFTARTPAAALPLATLDALEEGVAVYDTACRQVHANAALRRLAAAQDGFERHRCGAVLPAASAALRQLRLALAAAASGTPAGVAVPRAYGTPPFLVRCAPVPGHPGWVVLRVADPEARYRPPPLSFLRGAFGLTEAEAAVAAALCAGKTLTDHALSRGVSIHTVRTQLRALLQKTGAERQSDLISLLTALAR